MGGRELDGIVDMSLSSNQRDSFKRKIIKFTLPQNSMNAIGITFNLIAMSVSMHGHDVSDGISVMNAQLLNNCFRLFGQSR